MKKLLLLFFLLPGVAYAQSLSVIVGKVNDEHQRAIELATVTIVGSTYVAQTDESGSFHFKIDSRSYPEMTIRVSMVNRQTVTRTIKRAEYKQPLTFVLEELSLKLKEVMVTAKQKGSDISNSAIVFDRQALDQLQAYSLADVLNNLPGKVTTAPDLQYMQVATIRNPATNGDPTQQNLNSMGVAIYIDGIRVSNDANMQTKNIAVEGISGGAVRNTKDQRANGAVYDTPFGGLDLRNIPVDNIEKIEVVSGVASAKYGELTSGAIFITTKAGRTPYSASMRLNGSSVNMSLLKGFSLGHKGGDINANINYLNSVQNPTNSLKAYGRVTGGLKWTKKLGKQLTNSFSTDFTYKIDNAKIDPDDPAEEITYSKERRLSFTERLAFQSDGSWFTGGNLSLSYDMGYQESYQQRYKNGATLAVADKDTTGIYEGYFAPGNYYATEHIIGKPYNMSAGIDLNSIATTGTISHQLSYGASIYATGNNGVGVLADATRPPNNFGSGSSFKSDRPYDFDLQKPLLNFGFYAEDRVKINLFKRELSVNGGLRYDIQNNAPSWQPRVNANYKLSERWSLRAAYGIASKSPSMAYRYPAPTYFDIPLLLVGNGNANQSTYLVYTQRVQHDNSFLKPMRSSQLELGVTADYGFFNTSLYGYYKKDSDGYNTAAQYLPIYLPEYTYTTATGQKPVPVATGENKLYAGLSDLVVGNYASSNNLGIEWFLSTRKIKYIETSFTWNTSVAYTKYNNTGNTIAPGIIGVQPTAIAWYGIYPGTKRSSLAILSKLNSDTHIPELGFVVSLIMDISWRNVQQTDLKSIYPIGYIDRDGNTFPIETFDPNNPVYGQLLQRYAAASRLVDPPFVYTNLSLRIAKEIQKKIRVSLFAYNFLDRKVQYENTLINDVSTYNSPVSVGAEVSFKF